MAFISAWGRQYIEQGGEVRFDGDADSLRYLSRMDVFGHVGIDYDEAFTRHTELGRFIPLRLVEDSDSVLPVTEEILELILHQFDDARAFLPAVEWAVYEIVDNILLHSETSVAGVVCAQYFPNKHKLEIAVCDWGRGVKASLGEVLEPWAGHGEAIKKAVQRGVTRDPAIGQGNGLAGSLEIAKLNGGLFGMRSGDITFRVVNGQERGFREIAEFPVHRFG